ncbi:hypothetical protein BaRGS_00014391, partial [Batillaria attramentaria]
MKELRGARQELCKRINYAGATFEFHTVFPRKCFEVGTPAPKAASNATGGGDAVKTP